MGLAGKSAPSHVIPEVIDGRVIQYNVPFASIILSKEFSLWYSLQLAKIPYENLKKNSPILVEKIRQIVVNFYYYWKEHAGSGHHDYIHSLYFYTYYNT